MRTPLQNQTQRQQWAATLRERLHKSKLIIYSSLLGAGVIQIIIRERFPELDLPWPLIGGALMILWFAVLIVPPLLLVIRTRRRTELKKPELNR